MYSTWRCASKIHGVGVRNDQSKFEGSPRTSPKEGLSCDDDDAVRAVPRVGRAVCVSCKVFQSGQWDLKMTNVNVYTSRSLTVVDETRQNESVRGGIHQQIPSFSIYIPMIRTYRE